MKQTPLYERHVELGAKMVPYAGFLMPVEYSGVISEHESVRKNVGVFDVSHMGEIWVKGKNAFDFLQFTTSNDVSEISVGKAQYSCLPNGKGGIVDDIIVYKFEAEKYLLVVNASNTDKDFAWLQKNNSFAVELENASSNMAQLAVQGPKALQTVQKITDFDLSQLKNFEFVSTKLSGIGEVIISTTGYTGSGGVEIYCFAKDADSLWRSIFQAGESELIQPIGLAARDTLRLEMGYCLYGNDIDDTTSPIEAGLGWITKLNKSVDFLDKNYLFEQTKNGVARKLIGFKLLDRGIPRHSYKITNEAGRQIGEVTSGTMSPSLKMGIGMGYVDTEFAQKGKEIYIEIRNKLLKAQVVKRPFYTT